jgi:hypothetical protein
LFHSFHVEGLLFRLLQNRNYFDQIPKVISQGIVMGGHFLLERFFSRKKDV